MGLFAFPRVVYGKRMWETNWMDGREEERKEERNLMEEKWT